MEKLDVSWYVTTQEDVGGFNVTVYNMTSGKNIASSVLSYSSRREKFSEVPRGRYRVCIGTHDSLQKKRALQPAQCHGFFVSQAHTHHTHSIPAMILALVLPLLLMR
ncbi:hypothetical protein E2C01_101114 [Portunus trituberculatus]|uniref:Uncharacterized protein n=2 Tax=Portunus trituberculatus TaxID=210409 RepID=A0A5B7KF12_PORTR|nr:hypothetical protein [Portunus trituberculatus]